MIRITGELMNDTGSGNDVFDGYTLYARYSVRVEDEIAGTYRDTEVKWGFRGRDSGFFFELPDYHTLAVDKPLLLHLRNRSDKNVLESEHSLATLLRSDKPLILHVREVEPPQPVTPVEVRGRLVWRDAPEKITGFQGFITKAYFSALKNESDLYAPCVASTTLNNDNQFALDLPAKEQLADTPIEIAAIYPDGQIAVTALFSVESFSEEISLQVAQPRQNIVRSNLKAEDAQPVRLKGKIVDLAGKVAIRNKQVILWGQTRNEQLRPVLVTTTDGSGNFSGAWPKEAFNRGLATVAGTQQATHQNAIDVSLNMTLAESEENIGTFPTFIYLVVSVDPTVDIEGDCACHDTNTPRLPDADELVENSDTYSQDIGLNCVNFTTPNRTLEEFEYTQVVRTTLPKIKGTTLSDVERRKTINKTFFESLLAVKPDEASPSHALKRAEILDQFGMPALSAVKRKVTPFINQKLLDDYKTVAERGELSVNNSVDWDGTPTFYQATGIAHGHVIHYKQVWKADGYSLGDLLYSLPLAPGQKKQIVVFDWNRTEYGRRDEDTHEDEALNAYLVNNRDVYDIANAALEEHVKAGSSSHTSGEAGGVGGGVGALIGPVMIGVAGGYSASSGSASSSAWQDSSRNVTTSGLNQLRNMVQQGASAVRNQRSTIVQTARQSERFKVESEVVANHNHCHAITIEYFEVLRHYAIEQQLTHVQECLFVPLLMSQFDIDKVMRWRDILRTVLLSPRNLRTFTASQEFPLRRGLDACERIFLAYENSNFPVGTYAAESIESFFGDLYISFNLNRPLDDDDNADDPAKQEQLMLQSAFTSSGWNIVLLPLLGWNSAHLYNQYFANQKVKYKNKIFEERVAPVLAEKVVNSLKFTVVTPSGNRIPIQVDTTLVSNYQREVPLYCTVRPKQSLNIRRDQIEYIEISTNVDLAKAGQSKIIIRTTNLRYSTEHMNGYLARDYRADNDLRPGDPVAIYTPLSVEEKRDPRKEDLYFSELLIEHLNDHIEYYHKAIWTRMDPDRRYMLLDGFLAPNANGLSVASVVENRLIGIVGNSLVMPVAPGYKLDPTYKHEPKRDEEGIPLIDADGNVVYEEISLLDHYKPITPVPPFRVSVPTRGVFAEAVMGACNSCEKWDESRYWKWEEHPIPEEPTSIAPIQTTPPQRSDPGKLDPSAFPTPMINIQNAPPAPDPGATFAGALGVLGKSDLFKDITGLDQTQKNALQAMLSNQESAKHFADKAAELAVQAQNLKTAPTTIDSIKKSMADGSLDGAVGKKLIEDAYRAQISGRTSAPPNTAEASKLGAAAADAVRSGRAVKATQTHADGTAMSIEQGRNDGGGNAMGSIPGIVSGSDLSEFGSALKTGVEAGLTSEPFAQESFNQGVGQLLQVGDRYVRGAYTPNELAGLVGEQITEAALRAEGHIIFSDWQKHVSGTGFDFVTLDKEGFLWIVDNKAQFRGIGGANALTGTAYDAYMLELRNFLTHKHPIKAEADLAITAINGGKIKKVVSNGFAGEATRFTAGLFEKGLIAYDIRMAKLFSDHGAWKIAFDALKATRALRRTVRATGVLGINVLAFCAVAEVGNFMITSGSDLKQLALEFAADLGIDTILSRLPGGFFAGFALSLSADSPVVAKERELESTARDLLARMPGTAGLTNLERYDAVEALKAILRDPIQIPAPPLRPADPPKHIMPGLINPNWTPSA